MVGNWNFSRRLAAGFGFAGLVLLLIAVMSYRSTSNLIANESLVEHTHLVRTNLIILVSQVTDAETGSRGYIITGNDNYLEPYQSALQQINTTFETLRSLTADNPNQQRRLTAISPLIDAKLATLKTAIEQRRTGGFDVASKTTSTSIANTEMVRLRAIVAEADREEADLLAQRNAKARSSAELAKAVTLWGGLAGVIAVGLFGWLMTRSLSNLIGSAIGQVQSSSSELQAAASQQASGAKEQVSATTEITTTISELLATSRQIFESAKRVAQIAEQTAESARVGQKTVDSTHESITGIRRHVDQIVDRMLELGKKSQEIGTVLDIVSEMAEQTNILAINATIEAAGAGESGKRFAVVADEIRKLADRVGGSAKEIRVLIDDVRGAVNTTVMATETGSKTVDAGSRQFGDVASAFNQISGLVSTTTEAAREIELSTKQQTTAVEQVNVAIMNVAQAAKETESSSTQTLQTASQLSILSKELLRLIRSQAA